MKLLHRSKKKDGRSVEDSMATWVGALAHEIKNPLNTMKINLQLLQEDWNQPNGPDKTKALKRLETLNGEIGRLEVILNDFLRFVRLPQPNLEKYSVSSLLNELLDFTEPEAQQLNIKVIRDFSSDLPEIELDGGQIKQALLNIVLNANQSMLSGGQMTIKAYRTNSHISIDIIDTGEGISPERIDRLFDLFYSTKENGTGLGLSIAKKIIDMHGGEIRVNSREGRGTTFSVLLPIYRSRGEAPRLFQSL